MRKKEKLILKYSADDIGVREVFKFAEIAFIALIFIVVLFLLYPKGMLERQILRESSNYELTALYLKNMLRIEPGNRDLILATVRIALKKGKLDLTKELIEKLKNSQDKKIIKELLPIEYEYLKIRREKAKTWKDKREVDIKMAEVLEEIKNSNIINLNNSKKWFYEAVALKRKDIALSFLEPLIKINDLDSLEECVYLSSDIGDDKRRIDCLERLSRTEKEFPKKWLLALYSVYMGNKDYENSYKLAKRLASIDKTFKEEPARVKLISKDYKGASKEYMELYELEKEPEEKIKYLFKAIYALTDGGFKKEAVNLAERYQDGFLNNDDVIKKFIELYLSIESLDNARKLSEKLLNIEMGK